MTEFYPPDAIGVGRIVSGTLTITWDATPFRRKIRRIGGITTTSADSTVEIYIGAIAPACRIANNPFGAQQGYTPVNPLPVPAGSQIYLRFPGALGTDTASALLQTTGEMP
jgi:hypothetical protein